MMSPSKRLMIWTKKERPVLVASLIAAVWAVGLFLWVMRFPLGDLAVPVTYSGDALHVLMLVKNLIQGHWVWFNPHLAAPLGADMHDFPISMATDLVAMKFLSFFVGGPGTVVNLYWILSIAAAAAIATYCFLRLGFGRLVAVPLGIIYALQPFTFARGIQHISLVFHLVPLLATGAIELAMGRFVPIRTEEGGGAHGAWPIFRQVLSGIPAYLWIGCLMQGFGHIYDSFFGCYLFAVGALIAYMSRRKKEELVAAALVIAVTCFGAFIMITPSLLYWHQHGKSAIPEYKFAGDSEVYGLKVRHLLTPNREHPIGIFREVADKLDKARFPNENENATSRLGSVGALGFVFLVCWGLAGMVSGGQVGRPVVRASAALTFGAVLLATVGGLSSIFAALVSPEVRGYNRIVVFISFFCLTAFAPLLSRGFVWLKQHRADGITLACLAGGFAVLGVVDEAAPAQYLDYHGRRATWAADEKFVSSIEAQLPPNSMVFQLPHTDFPVEAQLPGKMQMYDQARPYIHSKTLRWSWGGFPGRQGEWSRSIAGLPPERMLIALSCAGFSGIWIDEFGYPPGASPLRQLMAATSQSPMWNPENRIAFIDIRGYRDKFMASLSEEQRVQVSRAALLEPVGVRFESFDGEEVDGARRWRWCPKTCAITLDNPTEIPKNVLLSATLQTGTPAAQEVDVKGPGFADAVLVSNATLPYSKTVRIPPKGRVSVTMSTDAPPVLPPPARTMRLAVQNLIIEEERWDPVRPAKSDGPTAVASGSVKLSFENFDVEEVDGARRWRWCPRTCAVTLYNPAELPKTVLLSATLQTGTPAAQEVDVKGPGFANAVLVSNATLPYSKTVRIPPKGRISVTMSTDAPPVLPPPARTMRLAVQNLTVTEKF